MKLKHLCCVFIISCLVVCQKVFPMVKINIILLTIKKIHVELQKIQLFKFELHL
ncbi:hypothetical protein ES288_D05G448400v1 [Gossypium darwinii]|uniref:Uncharacterized protein n=1 Tax=Gossypium darwinii TaxID=34276 RepID=A0A5D2CUY9_GOSDA|nr:hypothetical protein ES288_D05G448400v1 [Gossypium darwinii]